MLRQQHLINCSSQLCTTLRIMTALTFDLGPWERPGDLFTVAMCTSPCHGELRSLDLTHVADVHAGISKVSSSKTTKSWEIQMPQSVWVGLVLEVVQQLHKTPVHPFKFNVCPSSASCGGAARVPCMYN